MRLLIVALILALIVAGCGSKSVVGKWQYDLFGQSVILELKQDKTFSMGSASSSSQAGTYTVEDKVVTLKFGDTTQTMKFTMNDEGNTLTGSVGALNVDLKRVES